MHRPPEPDAATSALADLVTSIDDCIERLSAARVRAEELLEARGEGTSWLELVTSETRPLVVESISTVLATLARAGSTFRREQAYSLQAEHVSINRIAALFGVTRQRISALLRERAQADEPAAVAD
ncbi:hypothetical protein [Geodermatophilus sp. URMC 64]